MSDDVVRDLARRAGIAVEWQDYAGQAHVVSPPVLRRVLAALGLPADTSREMSGSRRLLTKRSGWADLPPLVTAVAGRPTRLDVGASEAQPAELVLENGDIRQIALLPARGRLRIPAIAEAGYHRLRVEDREIVLAVSPARCRSIEDVVPDARLWGIAAQLYGLRHRGDVGIGDLAGAADLARAAGAKGADAIALSPMHALYAADPSRFGPYSPSSRVFMNPLHAAPELVFGPTGASDSPAPNGLIDWTAASGAKYALLRKSFDSFLDGGDWNGPLGADFARYRADQGQLLYEHACFEALQAARMPQREWRGWPVDLRDPRGAAVSFFAAAHPDEILYHQFLQWISDRSLAAAQLASRQAGMRIGLIADLTVGMDPNGSHTWSRQSDTLLGLTIGAPPDLLNPRGQNWGLTGFSPRAMEENGFAPFLTTLRAAMRHTGGIRVDHAMGLARLWLIPEGASAADGAYLNFPVGDLLRLLALESVRHNVVVIGEDLGTVPEGFHDMLEQSGIHGMRVLWFERDAQTGFVPPRGWGSTDVAMTSTHDLPTVAGWWKGSDIDVRHKCGRLGEGVEPDTVRKEREADRPHLWNAFVREHLGEGPVPAPDDTDRVVDAAVRFIAKTEVPLSLIPLEDLLGQVEQPNLPGTVTEHPNWRRRLPLPADEVLADEAVARRIDSVAAERPRQ
ncbi:MAG TPA: 4-alpha-glucanotransferase [Acetobacteraceae bacterium]|jgi:4-alpha-glucanotransferase|nr:4-alpha-glucanotransferase [Acetobacteraceae bacterium]